MFALSPEASPLYSNTPEYRNLFLIRFCVGPASLLQIYRFPAARMRVFGGVWVYLDPHPRPHPDPCTFQFLHPRVHCIHSASRGSTQTLPMDGIRI